MAIPSSTYRVQLHKDFNFRNLEDILEYLHELGITTVYASPITTAFKGSQHGYDVTDPLIINPEIGSAEDLERLAGILRRYGMTWLQDIVPNHMAYDSGNIWLYDVLERGKGSEYFSYFDIDTDSSAELTGDKIMAPFLGSTLTECLQKGELSLAFTGKGFVLRYFDKEYPVAANLYSWVLTLAEGYPAELAGYLQEWERAYHLPAADWLVRRKSWLEQVHAHGGWISFIEQRIAFINERPALVETLVQDQHYILTHARLAAIRMNYRRFFTVNSLICLRMEDEAVFESYHRQLANLGDRGLVQGLRVDHIDGLAEPGRYIDRLRARFGPDCYIVAEKILAAGEDLPAEWDLQGTTGYEFLADCGQVLTDPEGAQTIVSFYKEKISGDMPVYPDLVYEKKFSYLRTQMGGEWNNLTDLLKREVPASADMDREKLKEALGSFMSALSVYRVYPEISPPGGQQAFLDAAFAKARQKTGLAGELAFLEDHYTSPVFFSRLMQFTGPLAAKGIEDTSFYIYNPLIAHNEVGDTPGIMGITIGDWHARMQKRLATFPHSLNASTTHDTKRGEDARIRLCWLSAIPDEWIDAVKKWDQLNARLLQEDNDRRVPSLNDEYFIYQSLLGAIPADLIVTDTFRDRFHGFLTKALREAGVNTSYDSPDGGYEKKCHDFVSAILNADSTFLEDFIPFAYRVIQEAGSYSLSQLLLKLTAPGIPDIYQGSECWDLSLVDPDNRLPVDYDSRKEALQQLREAEKKGWAAVIGHLHAHKRKGPHKLFLINKTLQYRNEQPAVFSSGQYIPVVTSAPEHTLAYIRRHEQEWALAVVPVIRRGNAPQGQLVLQLPAGAPVSWTNVLTGGAQETVPGETDIKVLAIDSPFIEFPVMLLRGTTR